VAQAFQAGQRDFRPLSVAELLGQLGLDAGAELCAGDHLRLWPHRHGTDGFFAAVWERA